MHIHSYLEYCYLNCMLFLKAYHKPAITWIDVMKLLLKQKEILFLKLFLIPLLIFPVTLVLVEPVGIRNIETYHLYFQES